MRHSLTLLFLLLAPAAAAQASEPRGVAFVEFGYARTWDDEGLLGTGAALSAGAGFRVSERWTIQALLSRVPYRWEASYLTIDGHFIFTGIEGSFQSRRRRNRPFTTIGVGMMNDDSVWTRDDVTRHEYTLAMFTASTGVEVRVSGRVSVVGRIRLYGLLDTGDDLAPHTSIQPAIGVTSRW